MPSLLSKGEGDAAPSTSNKRSSKFGLGRSKSKKNPLTEIKVDLHESHAEKEARRLKSYADPNMAVNQLEPCKWTLMLMLMLLLLLFFPSSIANSLSSLLKQLLCR